MGNGTMTGSRTVAVDGGRAVTIVCRDGTMLGGHLWRPPSGQHCGAVIINGATAVLADYYHYYARFLADHGFVALTYDYRGIGASRPERLRGCGYRWRDWGEQDFEAALRFMQEKAPHEPLLVVGHSIGGYLPGLAQSAPAIRRMLTIGAQYAYWRDYAPALRARMFFKWHVLMPIVTAAVGYFPGRRLGWLEDMPAGVANEWSFRGARMENSHPRASREDVLRRFAAMRADIVAISMGDDEFGTIPAVRRTLAYYSNARICEAGLTPADYGFDQIGHFGLFHARHKTGFWRETLSWLRDGVNPWLDRPFERRHPSG